jgi:hypothetical protein
VKVDYVLYTVSAPPIRADFIPLRFCFTILDTIDDHWSPVSLIVFGVVAETVLSQVTKFSRKSLRSCFWLVD